MTFHVPRPDWLPAGYKCWGQHGNDLSCFCGKAYVKWLRRAAAHADGRHSRAQVDCWACWQAGRFMGEEWAGDAGPQHEHRTDEMCGTDCERYWWEEARRAGAE